MPTTFLAVGDGTAIAMQRSFVAVAVPGSTSLFDAQLFRLSTDRRRTGSRSMPYWQRPCEEQGNSFTVLSAAMKAQQVHIPHRRS